MRNPKIVDPSFDYGSLVSVGIPSFERPELLKRAIESTVNQTYINLDIHISDNASSNSKEVASCIGLYAADTRIRFTQQAKNIGALGNFRFLIQSARGPAFVLLADDDYWAEDFVDTALRSHLSSQGRLAYTGHAYSNLPEANLVNPPNSAGPGKSALRMFSRLNSDSIIYGLGKTTTFKKHSRILREPWLPRKIARIEPGLGLVFASYPFLIAVVQEDGFEATDNSKPVHFRESSTRPLPIERSFRRSAWVFCGHVLVEVQLQIRLIWFSIYSKRLRLLPKLLFVSSKLFYIRLGKTLQSRWIRDSSVSR